MMINNEPEKRFKTWLENEATREQILSVTYGMIENLNKMGVLTSKLTAGRTQMPVVKKWLLNLSRMDAQFVALKVYKRVMNLRSNLEDLKRRLDNFTAPVYHADD